jgi:hypothetical protein
MVWLLAAALLLAQLLGLMHGVVHGPQAHIHLHSHVHHDGDHQERSALVHAEEAGERADEGGWLASLFSSHGGDSDCRLFDQASPWPCGACVLPMLSLPLVLVHRGF